MRKGGVARRAGRVVEGLRRSLKRTSETSANSDMRENTGGKEGCSVVRVNVCVEGEERERKKRKKTDEIPAVVLYGGELGLVDDGAYKVWESSGGVGVEEKVKGEVVAGVVAEVVELPEGVEEELEGVLAGNEGEDGVEGGESTPASGEDEKVGVTIWDEAGRGCGGGKVAG